MSSQAIGSTFRADLMAIVLFHDLDPSEPIHSWPLEAAKVYCVTGTLLSPSDVESFFYGFIESCGSVEAAKERVKKMIAADVTLRFHKACLPLFSLHPADAQVVIKKEEDADDEKKVGASSSFKPSMTQVSSVEHLLDVVHLFRAVEGYDVFDEPVGPRVVNTVMSGNAYASVVKQPMSLSLMRSLVRDGTISTLQQLECAVWKMAANCVFFNVPEGLYPGIARRFAAACTAIIHREAGG